jgi:uncharacterized protein YidB (DUF937 family)
MGILDSITGKIFTGAGTQPKVIAAILGEIGSLRDGGIVGVVNKFKASGLGEIVNSWVGTGKNLPITAEQIHQGLGSDVVARLAEKAGTSIEEMASHLSKLLPVVIDKVTPDGKIPAGDLLSKGKDLLGDLLK